MLDEVGSIHNELVRVVSQFISPAYRAFFLEKAEEDLAALRKQPKQSLIAQYVEKQSELIDVLKRQAVIFNMYYDRGSGI